MLLYHGAHTKFSKHKGQCFTDDEDVALSYAGKGGELAEIEIDLSDLSVVEVEGYDRDEDDAPGDSDISLYEGADIIVYDDEDVRGKFHRAWRVVSDKALHALSVERVGSVVDDEDDDYEDDEEDDDYE